MTLGELQDSLSQSAPPSGLPKLVVALWHDAHGDWEQAHEVAQSVEGPEGAWVHGYLHRKEGDLSNAQYWYSRAGRSRPDTPPGEEWKEIVESLLG